MRRSRSLFCRAGRRDDVRDRNATGDRAKSRGEESALGQRPSAVPCHAQCGRDAAPTLRLVQRTSTLCALFEAGALAEELDEALWRRWPARQVRM